MTAPVEPDGAVIEQVRQLDAAGYRREWVEVFDPTDSLRSGWTAGLDIAADRVNKAAWHSDHRR